MLVYKCYSSIVFDVVVIVGGVLVVGGVFDGGGGGGVFVAGAEARVTVVRLVVVGLV